MLQLSGILQKVDTEQDRRHLCLSQIKDVRNQSANKKKLSILQVEINLFIFIIDCYISNKLSSKNIQGHAV